VSLKPDKNCLQIMKKGDGEIQYPRELGNTREKLEKGGGTEVDMRTVTRSTSIKVCRCYQYNNVKLSAWTKRAWTNGCQGAIFRLPWMRPKIKTQNGIGRNQRVTFQANVKKKVTEARDPYLLRGQQNRGRNRPLSYDLLTGRGGIRPQVKVGKKRKLRYHWIGGITKAVLVLVGSRTKKRGTAPYESRHSEGEKKVGARKWGHRQSSPQTENQASWREAGGAKNTP